MKFVVKQAAEAPAEKPVELSIEVNADGSVCVMANGSAILALLPDGTVDLFSLDDGDRARGFAADSDDYIKIHGRIPC